MWRYSFKNLKKRIRNPLFLLKTFCRLRDDLNRKTHEVGVSINRRWYNYRYGDLGDEFIDGSWDNLIILDAARPELLRERFSDGAFETRYSPASYSRAFMETVYHGRELHDTVYVTSNPYASTIPDGVFHAIINLFESGFDEKAKTILPETVVESALQAAETYPNKRLIIHFMQPHYPFLGEAGNEFDRGLDEKGEHPWYRRMWYGRGDHDTLLQAYRENHDVIVGPVNNLISELNGQSVITADHANLVGERGFPVPIRLYGHPKDFPHPNLIRVPWITIPDDRRDVTSDPPEKQSLGDDTNVKQRLGHLGYTE